METIHSDMKFLSSFIHDEIKKKQPKYESHFLKPAWIHKLCKTNN